MPNKSIVITGYEITTDESTVAKQRAAKLTPHPHVRSDEIIRVLKEKLSSTRDSIPYSAHESQSRNSVIRHKTLHSAEDIAIGYLAQRQLAGRDTKPQDVQQLLQSLGLNSVNAANAIGV